MNKHTMIRRALVAPRHSSLNGTGCRWVSSTAKTNRVDLAIIGGGSGGLALAKEAKRLNPQLKVVCFEKGPLGGTCVNAGCIPKKLCHHAADMSGTFKRAAAYGYDIDRPPSHNWSGFITQVNNYIRSLNFSYSTSLRAAGVVHVRGTARMTSPHEVTFQEKGQENTLVAERIVLAVGGAPLVPDDLLGSDLSITSDDLFWRKQAPGKTLVVGGSYIALESAGFLHGLGYDTSVMVRSVLLRGFDQQIACQIGENMERSGVRFLKGTPKALERNSAGRVQVTDGNFTEDFDTVLMATGRRAATSGMGLEHIGVKLTTKGKVVVNEREESSLPHIFAIGDCASAGSDDNRPELTPVAIRAGTLLARRLYGDAAAANELMDYTNVPSAVFTPEEYGFVGLSEEDAKQAFRAENVNIFLSRYNDLESALTNANTLPDDESQTGPRYRSSMFTGDNLWARQDALRRGLTWLDHKQFSFEDNDRVGRYEHNKLLAKLVCRSDRENQVVGFHYLGPAASEATLGFALALSKGATKEEFDNLVGIHPTAAEEFAVLQSGPQDEFMKKDGCGGGGTCG